MGLSVTGILVLLVLGVPLALRHAPVGAGPQRGEDLFLHGAANDKSYCWPDVRLPRAWGRWNWAEGGQPRGDQIRQGVRTVVVCH